MAKSRRPFHFCAVALKQSLLILPTSSPPMMTSQNGIDAFVKGQKPLLASSTDLTLKDGIKLLERR